MTEPTIIGPGPKARAATDKLIDTLLTVAVEELGNGASRDQITDMIGVELNEPRVDLARMRLLAAMALGHLAVLRHAVEQLADTFEWMKSHRSFSQEDCAAMLRELVSDHG